MERPLWLLSTEQERRQEIQLGGYSWHPSTTWWWIGVSGGGVCKGRLESYSGTRTGRGHGLCGGCVICQVDEAGYHFLEFPSLAPPSAFPTGGTDVFSSVRKSASFSWRTPTSSRLEARAHCRVRVLSPGFQLVLVGPSSSLLSPTSHPPTLSEDSPCCP